MTAMAALALLAAASAVPVARAGSTLTVTVGPVEPVVVNVEAPGAGSGLVLTVASLRPIRAVYGKYAEKAWTIDGGRARHGATGLDLPVLGGELRAFEVDGLDLGVVRAGTEIRLPPASVLRIGPAEALVEHAFTLWAEVEVVIRVDKCPAPAAAVVQDERTVRAVAQRKDALEALEAVRAALTNHLAPRSPRARAILDAAARVTSYPPQGTQNKMMMELQLGVLLR